MLFGTRGWVLSRLAIVILIHLYTVGYFRVVCFLYLLPKQTISPVLHGPDVFFVFFIVQEFSPTDDGGERLGGGII